MTFDDIPAAAVVFLDSNTLVFHFTGHPTYGGACKRLLNRVEQHHIEGITSAHILAEVAHRLMTIEAMERLSWPATSLAARLKKHHREIPNLGASQAALSRVAQLGIQVLPLTESAVISAGAISRQHELLTNDAIVVAIMQANGLTNLASHDRDFDRVAGTTRYGPA
jgi:predicted nucleic acid-binding protein